MRDDKIHDAESVTQQYSGASSKLCYDREAFITSNHTPHIPANDRNLAWGAKPLGIAIHAHIIVGRDGHASFKGLG